MLPEKSSFASQKSASRLLVGISGSIAAYKSALIVSKFVQDGIDVRVAMTPAASHFIGPLTLETLSGHPVAVEPLQATFQSSRTVEHIDLAQWAEWLLIAPASYNTVNKIAQGIADNLLTNVASVVPFSRLILAPAMNPGMWSQPLFQENLRKLIALGVRIIQPESGFLACRDEGVGRMADEREIISRVQGWLRWPESPLAGSRVLMTVGRTEEPWDSVRYLSNRSSGKTGFAIACAARDAGADVTVIAGKHEVSPLPQGIRIVPVRRAAEMYEKARQYHSNADILIACAAVSDFSPKSQISRKMQKTELPSQTALELALNPDILQFWGENKGSRLLIGFTTDNPEDLPQRGREKLLQKNADYMVLTPLDNAGAETGSAAIIDRNGTRQTWPPGPKSRFGEELVSLILSRGREPAASP